MAINQLSIFVENKQGTLVQITEVLSKAEIDIRALSIADTTDFGILRIIVKDVEKAKAILQEANFVVSVNQVIGLEIPDKVGSISKVLRILGENNINIEYLYDFLTVTKDCAYIVIRVENNARATELFEANGIRCISNEDIV